MPVPKKRHSKSRSDRHHSAWQLVAPRVQKCTHCGAAVASHRVCSECGTYKSIPVMPAKETPKTKKGR